MTLDPALLAQVEALRDRLDSLEDEVFALRTDFRDGIRRLHAGGASMREIAGALGISHQRVHQIVGDEAIELEAASVEVVPATPEPRPAGDTTAAPAPRRANARIRKVRCAFCNAHQAEVKKMIAGPGVFICAACVAAAGTVARTGNGDTGNNGAVFRAVTAGTHKCDFCAKRVPAVPALAAAGRGRICTECLDLCDDILNER